jgi:hypothetical protein
MLIVGVWFWVLSSWLPVSENWGKYRHGYLLEELQGNADPVSRIFIACDVDFGYRV